MQTDIVLQRLDTARNALAEAKTIQETKRIVDIAAAAEILAKRQKLGEEAVQYATSIKVEALAQLGRMIDDGQKRGDIQDRGRPNKSTETELFSPVRLAELGLDKKTSKLAQDIAALPEEQFEAVKSGVMALSKAQKEVSKKRNAEKKTVPSPDGKYRVIYADPPWKYNSGEQSKPIPYPQMTIKEICDLPIKDIAEDNSVLFMWVTSPLLAECFDVIRTWGFEYKTSIVWDKDAHNVGYYVSVRHEFLLICTRGSCRPDTDKLLPSVVREKRTEHSVKPETFRGMIDEMYQHGRRIELFARRTVDGWDAWGNDVS